MKLKFWGTRGSIPSTGYPTVKYGGNTTCLELVLEDGSFVIFDAGTGIRKLGDKILKNNDVFNLNLIITHSHWDHIQGFPFFNPAYSDKYDINIFSCPSIFKNLEEVFLNQMKSLYFPVDFKDLKARINFYEIKEKEPKLGNAFIKSIRNNHPGEAYGFKVIENNKKIVFITDNELQPPDKYNTSLDEFVDFCKNVDILIHDAHYMSDDINIGYGHSSYEQAFNLGKKANVKHLVFFHHDPDRTDDEIDKEINKYKEKRDKLNINMKLDVAFEGLTYTI